MYLYSGAGVLARLRIGELALQIINVKYSIHTLSLPPLRRYVVNNLRTLIEPNASPTK